MNKKNNYTRPLIKWIVSVALLLVVFEAADGFQIKEMVSRVNHGWLGAGFLFFIGSMVVSAFQLNLHYQCLGLNLGFGSHMRLFWMGLFYDRCMPLGNGTAMKGFILHRQFGTDIKDILLATRLDRMSGVVTMLFLAGVGALTMGADILGAYYYIIISFLFLTIPLYSFVIGKYFYSFHTSFWLVNFHSLVVALMQALSAYFVLRALGVSSFFLEYQVLFLVSAAMAVFPYAIGGLGLRELAFMLGALVMGLDLNVGVVVALTFFIYQLLTAMGGGFLRMKSETPLSSRSKKSAK